MSDDNLSQFDLRFQDLLRHADWEVQTKPITDKFGCILRYRTFVVHRKGKFWVRLNRVFSDNFAYCLRDCLTRAELRQLSKFAREVVRFYILAHTVRT
jgi:hypothetical protein